jgi:hypothetical protein
MHTFWCRISLKKTLSLAQNLENKEPEFFLPPGSMVLKVVTGKIFKTLELARGPIACGSHFETAERAGPGAELFAFTIAGVGTEKRSQVCAPSQVVKDRWLSYR